MNISEILALTNQLQPWRPDSLTIEFIDLMALRKIPFCPLCADWHHADEECSITMGV